MKIPSVVSVSLERIIFYPIEINTIKKKNIKYKDPKNMVSTDNYILWAPVRFYHTKGKLDPSEMFSGGCTFFMSVVLF